MVKISRATFMKKFEPDKLLGITVVMIQFDLQDHVFSPNSEIICFGLDCSYITMLSSAIEISDDGII
jgi:hypothetical protein